MLPLFDLHLPTLTLVVCVVLFTAASTMTLVGRTQRTYLGYGWWTTAQWLNTAGAICLVLKDHHPWLLPVSVLLTLQWPLTMLGGLRQFYIRSDFRTAAWVDLVVLAAGAGAYMAMWMHSPNDLGARVATFSLASVTGYLYAAWLVHGVRHQGPGRSGPYLKAVGLFMLAAVGALILVAGSAALWVKHGWPERFAASTVAYDNGRYDVSPQRGRCHRDEGHDRPLDRSCVLGAGASKAVLWGDSHGVELAKALAVGDHAITQITYSHCPPAIGFDDPYRAGCKAHNQRVADWIAAQPIDTVVLAMRYHTYQDAPGFFQGLDRTIAMLRRAGKTVRIIGPVPFPGFDVPTHLANGGTPAISRAAWEAADRDTLNWLARNVPSDIAVLRPSDTLCNRTSCALARDGRSLYFDANHLTLFAARWVTREFWQNSTNSLSRSGKNM